MWRTQINLLCLFGRWGSIEVMEVFPAGKWRSGGGGHTPCYFLLGVGVFHNSDACYDRGITFRLKRFLNDGAP